MTGALATALAAERFRAAAVVTFLVTASDVTLAGIGSPSWGLAAGLAFLGLRYRRPEAAGAGNPASGPE